MKDCSWFIEGDIQSSFPTVNHRILMRFVEERIKDPIFLRLIKNGFKKVFTKHETFYEPSIGTPQGGILSPLLSNIYLDKFDKYMGELIKEIETPNSKARINPEIDKVYKNNNKSEISRLRVPYLHPRDTNHIKIKYVRYADDFVIGINGSLELAHKIKHKITEWMKTQLELKMSEEKTLITHISKGIKFLGYIIRRRTVFTKQNSAGRLLTRRMSIPTLDVDRTKIIKRLATAGYCDESGKPVPNFKLLQLPQSESNLKVNYILQGLASL